MFTPEHPMNLHIEHRPEHGRFLAIVDGHECVADYQIANGVMALTHTGVAPQLQGRGIAAALVQAALDYAQAQGFKVDPVCSYARLYMRRHLATLALLA